VLLNYFCGLRCHQQREKFLSIFKRQSNRIVEILKNRFASIPKERRDDLTPIPKQRKAFSEKKRKHFPGAVFETIPVPRRRELNSDINPRLRSWNALD
jgi:hypothetical protein